MNGIRRPGLPAAGPAGGAPSPSRAVTAALRPPSRLSVITFLVCGYSFAAAAAVTGLGPAMRLPRASKRNQVFLVALILAISVSLGYFFTSAPPLARGAKPPVSAADGCPSAAALALAQAEVKELRAQLAASRAVAPAPPPPPPPPPPAAAAPSGGGGAVGSQLGAPGVFPRARPRLVHSLLYTDPVCKRKADYVRGWRGEAVVVEVGAFHGEEIPQFKGLVKRLISYEPAEPKLATIRAVIAEHGMDDVVTLRPVAASARAGEATLQLAKGEGTQQDSLGDIGFMTKDNPTRKNVTIKTVRLDEEIHERVHLLKIDTQGHELSVLKGAEGIIRNFGVDV